MALSVKAALSVCGLFMVGLCYLVDQVALPVRDVAPRMLMQQSSGADYAVSGAGGVVLAGGPARGASSAFAHQNTVERGTRESRAAVPALAMAELPRPVWSDQPVPVPPPVIREQPVVAVAEPGQFESGLSAPVAAATQSASGPRLLMAVANNGGAANEKSAAVARAADTPGPVADAGPRSPKHYNVRRGDTLIKIARREWDSAERGLVELLLQANPKLRARPNKLYVGEVLVIPDPQVANAGGPAAGPAVAAAAGAGVRAAAPPPVGAVPAVPSQWYTVRKGDSLASIARRYLSDASRWREIDELNNLGDPHKIVPGTRIRLPGLLVSRG
jgi:nucleoid-associated protein YgaU